jgi:hypothetical protein
MEYESPPNTRRPAMSIHAKTGFLIEMSERVIVGKKKNV